MFADNDIGSDILADLTEDHLEKMGVSIGNRLRLLKAIGAEATNAADISAPATPPVAVAIRTAASPPKPLLSSDAERRPLTVMFCALADSTALSTQLDPEDLQDVIRG